MSLTRSARALLLWAIDDRKEAVPSFKSSLFAPTMGAEERFEADSARGFEPTEQSKLGFARTESQASTDFATLQ